MVDGSVNLFTIFKFFAYLEVKEYYYIYLLLKHGYWNDNVP